MFQRNTQKIVLLGMDLILHERSASSLIEISKFESSQTEVNADMTIFLTAKVVESALDLNWKNVARWRLWRRWKLKRKLSLNSLLRNVSFNRLAEISAQVVALEGLDKVRVDDGKKKVNESQTP